MPLVWFSSSRRVMSAPFGTTPGNHFSTVSSRLNFPSASNCRTTVDTASVIMRLVEQGLLTLDEPLVTWLPEFRVADPDASLLVTVRHLLTHTSGIDGDHFHDTGRGDDCLERYVESCAELPQLHPLGA